jgi:hypothetical protein
MRTPLMPAEHAAGISARRVLGDGAAHAVRCTCLAKNGTADRSQSGRPVPL